MKIENGRYEVLIRGKFTILASQIKQYNFCRPLLKLGLPCSSFMTFILNRFLCFYHCQKIAFLALLSICPSSWWPPTRRQLVSCRERDTRIIIASFLFSLLEVRWSGYIWIFWSRLNFCLGPDWTFQIHIFITLWRHLLLSKFGKSRSQINVSSGPRFNSNMEEK